MTDYPELAPEEAEALAEISGKLMSDGIDRESSDAEALKRVLERKRENDKKDPFRFLNIGDLPLTPPRWLVKGLIELDSFGEIFGEPGCGKSFLAVELACCVATGTPFFGFEIKNPGPVYYMAAEGRGGLIRRFNAWAIARGIPLKGAPLFLNETPLILIDEQSCRNTIAALKKKMDELKERPRLIALDTWSRNLGGDDSSPQDAAMGVSALDQIRSHFENVACLVIHHSGQNLKERSRGWSGLRAAVDFEFKMERGIG
jgi:RecA-family ATPase